MVKRNLQKFLIMLIGELSRRTGFSHDTIRFYEKRGLIKVNRRERRSNNYKEYPEAIYEILVLIRTVKDLGFTLSETGDFIRAWGAGDASCVNLTHHLSEKVDRIDEQITLLRQMKSRLSQSIKKCQAANCQFEKLVPSCISGTC
jgi:DNA-binding transcriptional MerR regulator